MVSPVFSSSHRFHLTQKRTVQTWVPRSKPRIYRGSARSLRFQPNATRFGRGANGSATPLYVRVGRIGPLAGDRFPFLFKASTDTIWGQKIAKLVHIT